MVNLFDIEFKIALRCAEDTDPSASISFSASARRTGSTPSTISSAKASVFPLTSSAFLASASKPSSSSGLDSGAVAASVGFNATSFGSNFTDGSASKSSHSCIAALRSTSVTFGPSSLTSESDLSGHSEPRGLNGDAGTSPHTASSVSALQSTGDPSEHGDCRSPCSSSSGSLKENMSMEVNPIGSSTSFSGDFATRGSSSFSRQSSSSSRAASLETPSSFTESRMASSATGFSSSSVSSVFRFFLSGSCVLPPSLSLSPWKPSPPNTAKSTFPTPAAISMSQILVRSMVTNCMRAVTCRSNEVRFA
mmetsp:Transcript_64035/g.169601  ORF Transcript_64035/g.169601 Transcript_64035/m.169601 type:complete len:307 (-) Transcript_64035:1534-2454(-)